MHPVQVDIDAEIAVVHNFMRDHYRSKFPELESLVHHAVDYARVVRAIGNEMDLTLVDLEDILPQVRPRGVRMRQTLCYMHAN